MPIDTSSYYPEVPDQDNNKEGSSLNSPERDLFNPIREEIEEEVIIVGEVSEEMSADENKGEDKSASKGFTSPSDHLEPEYPKSEGERLIDRFSNVLSWLLVPLLMPVYGLLLAFGLSILDVVPIGMRVRFVFIILGITFAIPVFLVFILKFLGIIDDIGLNGRKERLIPYIITALCNGGAAWFMAMRGAPIWLVMFFAGGALAALINLAVNFRWKISAHAAGMAGLIALLIRIARDGSPEPELFTWLLITVGASGLLGSARIWLGRHTTMQVLAGYCVGFCSVFFLMSIH